MYFVDPTEVLLDGLALRDVEAISVDISCANVLKFWRSDAPDVVFADGAHRVVTLKLTQRVEAGSLSAQEAAPNPLGPTPSGGLPGAMDRVAVLEFFIKAGRTSVRARVSARVVITSIAHDLMHARGVLRRIEMIAVSPDGSGNGTLSYDVA